MFLIIFQNSINNLFINGTKISLLLGKQNRPRYNKSFKNHFARKSVCKPIFRKYYESRNKSTSTNDIIEANIIKTFSFFHFDKFVYYNLVLVIKKKKYNYYYNFFF